MPRRIIAQRILSQEILDWEVPLALRDNPPRRDLSGPGQMNGAVETEYLRLLGADGRPRLEEWSTALYLEIDGRIRWGGIITGVSFDGARMNIECAGFSAYLKGLPFLGEIRAGVPYPQGDPFAGKDKNNDGFVDNTDPPRSTPIPDPPPDLVTPSIDTFEAVRRIWEHVQKQFGGDLGMVVDTLNSGIMLGTPDGEDPYELVYWEAPDCGDEIDNLASDTPFDYVEEHYWSDPDGTKPLDAAGRPFGHADYNEPAGMDRFGRTYASGGLLDNARRPKGDPAYGQPSGLDENGVPYATGTSNGQPRSNQIAHRLRLATPTIGSRRTNLSFRSGENIIGTSTPESNDEFANEVYIIGKGEGRKTVHERYPQPNGRLRRVHVYTDKRLSSPSRMAAKARTELARHAGGLSVPLIAVKDSPNARLGSWQLGDEILVEIDVPWVGKLKVWHRIVSEDIDPEGTAVLSLVRADAFT